MLLFNPILFLFHSAFVAFITLFFSRLSKEWLYNWLSLLIVLMNFFVIKRIHIFNFEALSSDALVVGFLLGLNMLREFYGEKAASKMIKLSFFIPLLFLFLSGFHLLYSPSPTDTTHFQFLSILTPVPRFLFSGVITFLIVQIFDVKVFSLLKSKTGKKYLTLRASLAMILAQFLDTVLFGVLAFYGTEAKLIEIMVVSFLIKVISIYFISPLIFFMKNRISYQADV